VKTMSVPNSAKTMMIGASHHFFRTLRNAQNSPAKDAILERAIEGPPIVESTSSPRSPTVNASKVAFVLRACDSGWEGFVSGSYLEKHGFLVGSRELRQFKRSLPTQRTTAAKTASLRMAFDNRGSLFHLPAFDRRAVGVLASLPDGKEVLDRRRRDLGATFSSALCSWLRG
jgi:hypothetical protein